MLNQFTVQNITAELATPIESEPAFIMAQRVLARYHRTGEVGALRSYESQMMILTEGRAYRAGLLAVHYAQLAA